MQDDDGSLLGALHVPLYLDQLLLASEARRKRRSHQGSPRLERASDPAPPVRSNNGMPLSSEPR